MELMVLVGMLHARHVETTVTVATESLVLAVNPTMASMLLTILAQYARMEQPALEETPLARHVGPTVIVVMEMSVLAVILDMGSFRLIIAARLVQMEPMVQVEMHHAHHVGPTVTLAPVIIPVLVASLTMGSILSHLLAPFVLEPTRVLEVIPRVLHVQGV